MKRSNAWISSDFDDDFETHFNDADFAKPLPPSSVPKSANKRKINNNLNGKIKSNGDHIKNTSSASHFKTVKNNGCWSDTNTPKSSDELAVHIKKISEVKMWLENNSKISKSDKNKGILLLTGPAGSGKTATIKALCGELNIYIQEWSAPMENSTFDFDSDKKFDEFDNVPYSGHKKNFELFMARANRFAVLGTTTSKIILIEDIPTFAFRDTTFFQQTLKKHHKRHPIVIIQSESSSKDDKIRLLFPSEFIQELSMNQISFNPIAPTNMVKALQNIIQKESQQNSKILVPDKNTLNSLATNSQGDIRSAINSLQFACRSGTSGSLQRVFQSHSSLSSSNSSGQKKKKSEKIVVKDRSNEMGSSSRALASIGGKDSSLDLFHMIGKVLYCKRTEEQDACESMNLVKTRMRKKLVIDPEELLENLPTSTSGFIGFLQQSCLDFFTDITNASKAVEYLSVSDQFFNEWTHTGKISLSDYGGLVSIRGLCHSNADPVRRFSSGMKTFQKPEFYSVIKKSQSNMDILSQYFRKDQYCHSREEIALTLAPFSSEYFPMSIPDRFRHKIVEASQFKNMPIKIRMKSLNSNRFHEKTSGETTNCDLLQETEEEFVIDEDSD